MSSLHAFLRDYLQFNYSVDEIVEKYVQWVSIVTYMILNRIDLRTYKSEVFAVKSSKRGNDVYRSRVYRRFKGLVSLSKRLIFFNPKDRKNSKTRALWVTLTYDHMRCSVEEAWRNIGVEFNRYMSYVRRKYGKVSCCRVFESYKKGYPHIHCILLFEEAEFRVFRDKKGKFRIFEKEILAEGWHSYVDVQGMSSLGRGFSYLKKYLLKSIDAETEDSLALKTLALCWAFRKRAFSVSGKFRQLLSDLIQAMHNSNLPTRQTTLEGDILPQEITYYVIGFVPANVIRLKNNLSFSKLNNKQIRSVEEFLESKKYAWDKLLITNLIDPSQSFLTS